MHLRRDVRQPHVDEGINLPVPVTDPGPKPFHLTSSSCASNSNPVLGVVGTKARHAGERDTEDINGRRGARVCRLVKAHEGVNRQVCIRMCFPMSCACVLSLDSGGPWWAVAGRSKGCARSANAGIALRLWTWFPCNQSAARALQEPWAIRSRY